MAGVKGGEAAFKLDTEVAAFNAYSTIMETFKFIEEAIGLATTGV